MSDQKRIDEIIDGINAGLPLIQLEVQFQSIDLNLVGTHGRTPLMAAVVNGSIPMVEALVRIGAGVQASGHRQLTALHEAAAHGEVEIVKYLISLGAVIDAVNNDGVTPLMCAAAWGNHEAVEILLKSGADWRNKDARGSTASDIAREKGEDSTADLIDFWSEQREQ